MEVREADVEDNIGGVRVECRRLKKGKKTATTVPVQILYVKNNQLKRRKMRMPYLIAK